MSDTFTVSRAQSERGLYHLSRRYPTGLEPVCGATPAQRITGFCQATATIEEAFDGLLGVPTEDRCEKCWDEGLRIKHPRTRRRW